MAGPVTDQDENGRRSIIMISRSKPFILAMAVQLAFLVFVAPVSLRSFKAQLPVQDKSIDADRRSEVKQLLQDQLGEGEAIIWYLSHCGYAVKTKSALLIFDYWEKGRDGRDEDNPHPFSLASGRIDPEEIKELNVYVFVTHAHLDHYDRVIFEWKNMIKNISYILGWRAEEDSNHHHLPGPRSELNISGMQVSTINETHDGLSGVCYLVKVDGLCLYFSGDYGWAMSDSYKNDFEYVSTRTGSIDMAFLNPCYYQKDSILVKLEIPSYFIQRFSPKIVFPQHYGGREELMAKCVDRTREDFPLVKFASPMQRGQRWRFKIK